MQATLTFPCNTILPYQSGNSSQNFGFALPCGVSSSNVTVTNVTVNGGAAPLILLPSLISGGANSISITSGPTYSNNEIVFAVQATPDPSVNPNTIDSVVINLTLQVTYTYTNASDGLSLTAAASVLEIQNGFSNYQLGISGSNPQSPNFYGHMPALSGQGNYPANSMMMLAIALKQPGPTADSGDVVINVSGNGNATCTTAQVTVTVNNQSGPMLAKGGR